MGQKSKQKDARRKANLAKAKVTPPPGTVVASRSVTKSTSQVPRPEWDKKPEVSQRSKAAVAVATAMEDAKARPAGSLLKGEGFTEEDQAYGEAERWAKRLLADEKFSSLFGAMVNLRRSYIILYRRLQKLLEETKGVHQMTEDFLVQAAMFKAAQEFDAHQVMESFPRTVLRTIADIIDEDTAAENDDIKQARRAADEARRKINLPFELCLDGEGSMTWDRKLSLVLAGWRPAVRWLADRLGEKVLASSEKFAILRLREDEVKKEDPVGSLNLHIGSKAWQGCCNSQNALMRLVFDFGRGLAHLPDLIVCENMALAHTKSYLGRPPGAVAGDAHKIFRKWCDENGCGLLGLLPSSTVKPPDISAKEYEQLRTFAIVRVVDVYEGLHEHGDEYRVSIRGSDHVWWVPKVDLDNRESAGLIVPDFALVK